MKHEVLSRLNKKCLDEGLTINCLSQKKGGTPILASIGGGVYRGVYPKGDILKIHFTLIIAIFYIGGVLILKRIIKESWD